MQLSVQTNVDDVIKLLTTVQQRQVPFAAAQALTFTAQDILGAVRGAMQVNFTLRRDWVVQGIRVKPASKETLTARVYSRDPFMGLQESGGTKASIQRRVFDYGEYLAVPLDARRSKSDVVRRDDWPQNLIKPFILTARDGRKYLAVHALGGSSGPVSVSSIRGKARQASGVKLMYTLVPKVEMKARLHLIDIAKRMYLARFQVHFQRSLAGALATAH